ncbi:PREDICTED: probable polygalacturonase At1g80170 isoform X1 [Fragaria vesca subsp. vesca]|uniref:probable polygalacturonase At1g80170 isoform X1 n=2 Tax=Fragaria vesca subsp. vesca TaxID=101020 RepID=UPI0002C2FBBE|nr:PREDICTED: probable polygalacturonase At1g80170 isoform X1 [Fragaria vesca subsp. vesca]XP_011458137.1 PREDICTED: probable polygalacturonase At1g80170 isoform X1 [Fragaria vesca subsp. vesca]XP_011458141.1 PREDICTED: probable polygalacturonase At1g80170 isoform X1 [Fragaria vesca subsp. vesca]XP_011458143.1 PREDICTED: probable polygalacturonase At1g80170 isoform X1 [Fragaria vesca subsp. vesca]XP_011458146.1 PREDICTED: probable polygalacturonase At1g80170 isoform X1 [Fragaria vesca subsp. ve
MGSYLFLVFLGIVYVITASSEHEHANTTRATFNVLDYGAVSGRHTDSGMAFWEAWNATCSSEAENSTLIIPRMRFLLSPITFDGPCKPQRIKILILGRLLAPESPEAWRDFDPGQWLAFRGVNGLEIAGPGTINGRGSGWWNQSCRYHPKLEGCTTLAPTALKVLSCKNIWLRDIHFINSSQSHILIEGCDGIKIENLMIEAPGNSPNTDGIHIHASHNVIINNTIIASGDDCISIGDHISNIAISYIKCGPGHGISIGSLGKSGNVVQVENVHVSKVTLQGTTNGARIKTWQVGQGNVRGVRFEDFFLDSVKNPIIIDQNYCKVRGACEELPTGVHISDVSFKNFYGTSSTNIAINLNCSLSVPCTEILMKSIYLRSAIAGQNVTSSCRNAYGIAFGVVHPSPCFQI